MRTAWGIYEVAFCSQTDVIIKQDMQGRRLLKAQFHTHSHPFNGKRMCKMLAPGEKKTLRAYCVTAFSALKGICQSYAR